MDELISDVCLQFVNLRYSLFFYRESAKPAKIAKGSFKGFKSNVHSSTILKEIRKPGNRLDVFFSSRFPVK
jgi:hypothetical protein